MKIETLEELEKEWRTLPEKIRSLRKKRKELKDELDLLLPTGHARIPGIAERIRNINKALSYAYFFLKTGYKLGDERIGPADEPPSLWDKKQTL